MIADAYSIWLQTRSAVTGVHYPTRIDYTIAVSGLDGTRQTQDHYRASCDPADGTIRVLPISDEQLARPAPDPRGVNVKFAVGINGIAVVIPLGRPEPSLDLMGVPLLAPTYMFGLRYPSAATAASPDATAPLPVIAIVSSQALEYRVALIDTPTVEDTPTYHLKLTPLRRPKDNRLRELWVGTADYLPRKAIVAGNFTVRPLDDVPWTIDFSVVDGIPYVARERADAALYLAHRRVVSDAVIAFQDIREPGSIYNEPLISPKTDDTLVEPPGVY